MKPTELNSEFGIIHFCNKYEMDFGTCMHASITFNYLIYVSKFQHFFCFKDNYNILLALQLELFPSKLQSVLYRGKVQPKFQPFYTKPMTKQLHYGQSLATKLDVV